MTKHTKKLTTSQCSSSEYCKGCNDAIDAMKAGKYTDTERLDFILDNQNYSITEDVRDIGVFYVVELDSHVITHFYADERDAIDAAIDQTKKSE